MTQTDFYFVSFSEVLPYVPHTCYLGTEVCETIIGDCAEYSRLRECCCDKFTKEYCKYSIKRASFKFVHNLGVCRER